MHRLRRRPASRSAAVGPERPGPLGFAAMRRRRRSGEGVVGGRAYGWACALPGRAAKDGPAAANSSVYVLLAQYDADLMKALHREWNFLAQMSLAVHFNRANAA